MELLEEEGEGKKDTLLSESLSHISPTNTNSLKLKIQF